MLRSLLVLALLATSPAWAQIERPLIVIPGILGSRLGDDRCERITWGDRNSLWRFDELRLSPDGRESRREHRPCGLIEGVQILGPLKVDAYADLLTSLRRLDYRDGETLFTFPYDWRRSNFVTAQKLKELLDKPPLAGREVDILAHSMGGHVARIFVQELGGAARVKRLVTMGTPHLGSARMLEVLDGGWGFWANLAAGGLGQVRAASLSFPSIYELMPQYNNCCAVGGPGDQAPRELDALEPSVWTAMPWMPSDFRSPEARAFVARSLLGASRLKEIVREGLPSSIDFYPICTGLLDTTWRVLFDPSTGAISDRWAGKGDGTVHVRSAADGRLDLCRASLSEHSTIFANDAARQHLDWILRPDRHTFEPKAGVLETEIALRVETRTGVRLGVSRIALELQPAAVQTGRDLTVRLGLFGDPALGAADLPSDVRLPAGAAPVPFVSDNCTGSLSGAQLCLTVTVTAPSDPGPTRLEVKLPGVDPIGDILLVL